MTSHSLTVVTKSATKTQSYTCKEDGSEMDLSVKTSGEIQGKKSSHVRQVSSVSGISTTTISTSKTSRTESSSSTRSNIRV